MMRRARVIMFSALRAFLIRHHVPPSPKASFRLARALLIAIAALVLVPSLRAQQTAASATAGRDPNLPTYWHGRYIGTAANQFYITAVYLDYPNDASAVPIIRLVYRGTAYPTEYHGFTNDGAWISVPESINSYLNQGKAFPIRLEGDHVKIVEGAAMDRAKLKRPGGSTVSTSQARRDPNLPTSATSTTFSATPNDYNISTVTLAYPDVQGAQPIVHVVTNQSKEPQFAGYLGFNNDGAWFGFQLNPRITAQFTLHISNGIATVTKHDHLPPDLPNPTTLGLGTLAENVNPLVGHDAKITRGGSIVTLTYIDAGQHEHSYAVIRPKFMQQALADSDEGSWIYLAPDKKSGINFNFNHGSVTGQAANPMLLKMMLGP